MLRPSSLAIAAITIVTGLVFQTVLHEQAQVWKAEGGFIETASAVIWAVAAVVALVRLVRAPSPGWLAGTVMLTWAVLRELDFQTAFTYRSIESLGFYTRPIAGWDEKFFAILALLPFAVAGLYLVRLLWLAVRRGEAQTSSWAGDVLVAFGLLALSMAAEKLLGFDTFEETCELGFAAVGVLLTWHAAESSLERRRETRRSKVG